MGNKCRIISIGFYNFACPITFEIIYVHIFYPKFVNLTINTIFNYNTPN